MTRIAPIRTSNTVRYLRLLLVFAILALVVPAPFPLRAAPSASSTATPSTPGRSASEDGRFELSAAQPSLVVAEGGSMHIDATATAPAGTGYLEVRLRVFRPQGGLLHQKTEIRHDTTVTATPFSFKRDLAGLEMDEGRYPFELQMRADGTEPIKVEGRVLVYDPASAPVRVALVTRLACAPGLDPQGNFVLDPAQYVATRDAAFELDDMLSDTPGLKLSAAVPPLLLEEWTRTAAGYSVAGPEGVREVGKEMPVPLSYERALDSLRDIARSPRAEILNVPYADPDIVGLQTMWALDDLREHYREGLSTYLSSLGTTPSPVTNVAGGRLPHKAGPILEDAGIRTAVLEAGSIRTGETTIAPGAYRAGKLNVLVLDRTATEALERGDESALVDVLFARRAKDASMPVAVMLRVGTGESTDLPKVSAMLRKLASAPWVDFITTSEALDGVKPGKASLRPAYRDRRPAPPGYWDEVAEARKWSAAISAAAPADNRDAAAVRTSVLLAESRCWAGPDSSWPMADRGRSFSAAASRRARGFFGKVTIEGQDITLSGTRGRIPLNVRNASGQPLKVRLLASAKVADFPKGDTLTLALQKADNYLTLPVDLRSALSDGVRIEIMSGELVVARANLRVRGSYLDRVALVGMVAIALAGMLWFIRRRLRAVEAAERADAGNIR